MTVEEIYSDREGFAKNVRAIAGPDVSKMGIRIISFVIQNITDNVSVTQHVANRLRNLATPPRNLATLPSLPSNPSP